MHSLIKHIAKNFGISLFLILSILIMPNAYSEQSAESFIKERKALFSSNYKTAKRSLGRQQVINKLGLSEERVAYYEDNIEEACFQKPGVYDYLIELQGVED